MINLRNAQRSLPNSTNIWNKIDLNRRAAVLALLYRGVDNQVSCVLTTRSGHISYAGDAAFPGGKADTLGETSLEVARREAFEEIGLPLDLKLEPLLTMPAYLSSRYLCVVPQVAWLDEPDINPSSNLPRVIDSKLLSHEVNKVFGVRISKFLSCKQYSTRQEHWAGLKFNQHYFKVPAREKQVGEPANILVWGLTANILIDIARLWYQKEPEFAHRKESQFGDQQLIDKLVDLGYFNGAKHEFINFGRALGKESELLRIRSSG